MNNKQDKNIEFIDDNYKDIIKSMINTIDITKKQKELLLDLFGNPSFLTISSYKKFLRYKANIAWKLYHDENSYLYENLAAKICSYLRNMSFDMMIDKYGNEIKLLHNITNKKYDYIHDLFKNYKDAYDNNDNILIAKYYSDIRRLIKSFNSKSKEKFILDFVNEQMLLIKDKFKHNRQSENSVKENIDTYIVKSLNDNRFYNRCKLYIEDRFNISVDKDQLSEIIYDILKGNNLGNYKLFSIDTNLDYSTLDITKTYNRLVRNYTNNLNWFFSDNDLDNINKYLKEKNISKKKKLRINFTRMQLYFLDEIYPLLKRSNSYIYDDNDILKFNSSSNILNYEEEKLVKNKINRMASYKGFSKIVFSDYYHRNNYLSNSSSSLLFNDNNYSLVNNDYLYRFDLILKIFSNINLGVIDKLATDNNNYSKLKELIINDGLLACILFYGSNEEIISDIINNILYFNDNEVLNINKLNDIVKKISLFKYIDPFTLSLLGEEVTDKIVFDAQFINDGYNPLKIKERIDRANYLMIKGQEINSSTIPYFESIKLNGLSLNRYNNNDSNILTSGIDSNTCFKISGADNDYLFYSILNKNGMIANICDNGEFVGRLTAHRYGNCLMINSVRSRNNDYEAACFEDIIRYDNMVKLVDKFANYMIKETTDSLLPIDFVICNKAGILSSFEYNNYYPIVPDCFFKNPIDCYHDDFNEFITDNFNYLDEAKDYERGDIPFTTDFGNYPIIMLASRSGKMIERRFDIDSSTSKDNYKRKDEVIIGTKLDSNIIRKIERIDAIDYYNNYKDISNYKRINYNDLNIISYEVGDNYYVLVDSNCNVITKTISGNEDCKKLIL